LSQKFDVAGEPSASADNLNDYLDNFRQISLDHLAIIEYPDRAEICIEQIKILGLPFTMK